MKRVAQIASLLPACLLLTGCAKETRSASYNPGQKWEYKAVKLDKGEDRDLTTLLNVMAREGWEFDGQVTTEQRFLVFKRSTGLGGYGATAKYETRAVGGGKTEVRPARPVPQTQAVPGRRTERAPLRETRAIPAGTHKATAIRVIPKDGTILQD